MCQHDWALNQHRRNLELQEQAPRDSPGAGLDGEGRREGRGKKSDAGHLWGRTQCGLHWEGADGWAWDRRAAFTGMKLCVKI